MRHRRQPPQATDLDTKSITPAGIVGAWLTCGSSRLVLATRDGTRRHTTEVPARWSLFVARDGLDAGVEADLRRHALRVELAENWIRTDWRCREARDGTRDGRVRGARAWLEERGVEVREGDVGPLARHLADTGHEIACSIDRLCYYDLETDSRVPVAKHRDGEARVLSFAVVSHTGEVTNAILDADTDEAEARLLRAFLAAIEPYDTCTAWNGEAFDERVLQSRCERRGISPNWRRWCWLDHMRAYEKYAIAATGEQKPQLSLNSVALAVTGEGKLGTETAARSFETWRDDPVGLLAYNEQDARLMRAIETKTGYLRLHHYVCRVCRCLPTTRSLQASEIVDGYMLRLGAQHGHRWPCKRRDAVRDPYEGALVLDPAVGAHDDVRVIDFASLYPSVIQTFNISPDTLLRTAEARDTARSSDTPLVIAPKTGATFRADEVGMFPAALDDLVARRKELQATQKMMAAGSPEWEEADGVSKALKVVINSFYGVMGLPSSRYYVRECAETVSLGSRWVTESLLEFIAKEWPSLRVVAGDTDSAFLLGSDADVTAMVQRFNDEHMPSLLPRYGCRRNTIHLEYEKVLRRAILVSKKHYAASVGAYKGTAAKAGTIEVKGLEYRRGDQVRLARSMQKEVIDLLLRDGPMPEAVECERVARQWRERLRVGDIELADVVVQQTLTKDEYATKTPPPHARVAEIMKARGEDISPGTRIRYWIAGSKPKFDPRPASDFDAALVDRGYYWEHRVWPPTRRLLEAALPTHDWTAIDRLDDATPTRRKRRDGGDGSGQGSLFAATEIEPLSGLVLLVDGRANRDWAATWEAVRAVLDANPGSASVVLRISGDGSVTSIELGPRAGAGARRHLERVLGRDAVLETVAPGG